MIAPAIGLAISGGVLVGLGLLLALAASGRPVGVSGVVGGLLFGPAYERGWRGAFLAGLLLGGAALAAVRPEILAFTLERSLPTMAGAGLLVGFGTRLANDCTSGHGVCGLGRLAPRSVVATAIFTATGAAAVLVVERLLGGRA